MANRVEEKNNVLICVTGQISCERLIHAGVEIAQRAGGTAYVLHVAQEGRSMLGYKHEPEALEYLFGVSVKHGADMVVVHSADVKGAIEQRAKELNAGTIVAGRALNYGGWDLLDEIQLRLPDVRMEIFSTPRSE